MYIEGFVVPVKTARKADYLKMSAVVAGLYREHGAIRCVETWGHDVPVGERTSFPRAVELAEDETTVFAWMEFPDKATRDAAHKAVWSDPRMPKDMHDGIVAGERMILGGFEAVLDLS